MVFETRFPGPQWRKAHEHYAELCGLFTSGSLTDDELLELNTHLSDCESCAKLLHSYRAVARSPVSLLAPAAHAEAGPPQKPWAVENAKKQLLNRIEAEKAAYQRQLAPRRPSLSRTPLSRNPLSRNPFRTFIPLTSAAVLLVATMSAGFAYHLGQARGLRTAQQSRASTAADKQESTSLQALVRQRSALEGQLAARNREVERLKQELQLQMAAITESKLSQGKLQRDSK